MRSSRRRILLLVVLAAVVATLAVAAMSPALPWLVRQMLVARVQAMTGRPVTVEEVRVNLFRGGVDVRGLRLAERDGAPFADVEHLSLRLRLGALLLGHIHVGELVLQAPTVRVVRLATNEFNFSDLIRSSGTTTKGPLHITVDRFAIENGTVSLEDRALPQTRTWVSERIAIEARNVSTRRDDGTAQGRSVTAGAPVTVEVERLRLYPVHLQARVTVEGLDVSLAQLYLPPTVPLLIERGRAHTRVEMALDAREGLRVDATTRLEDLALGRLGSPGTAALAPRMTVQLTGFTARDGALGVAQLDVAATAAVLDPRVAPRGRVDFPDLQAHVAELTRPVSTPARIDVRSGPSRAGTFSITGTLRPEPEPSEVRMRAAGLDLAPWAVLLPVSARISGIAEADLAINEPLAAQVPTRVRGTLAVRRPAVADKSRTLLSAERIAATGLEVRWPARVKIGQLLVEQPHALVERDRAGQFPLLTNLGRQPDGAATAASPGATAASSADAAKGAPSPDAKKTATPAASPGVDVGAIVVRGGTVDWHDDAVAPAARLRVSGLAATVTGIAWPLRGPAGVRLALQSPGGGELRLDGRVGVEPLSAEGHIVARGVDLAPYRPYVPIPARIEGRADLDLQAALPAASEGRLRARGSAALSRLDVQDDQRTVLRVTRAAATGLDVDWPERIRVDRVTLKQPWVLLERDDRGQLPMRAVLTPRRPAAAAGAEASAPSTGSIVSTDSVEGALAVRVTAVSIEDGGARLVDRAISPAFAVDVSALTLQGQGLSTTPAPPARFDLSARLASGADLTLRGTMGHLAGPLRLDLSGDLRRFDIPRANTYLTHYVAWQAREGSLATGLRLRLQGDALDARTEIRLSQLAVNRARGNDQAQAHIGLPLGLIVGLMKDRRGDIAMAFPVGGRLSDPRFDFSEAIWKAVRQVAVNAITLPVSWIGRVRMSDDSRIEDIELDPLKFEPGSDVLTSEGQAQMTRVAAFLEQLPDMRLSTRPVVSGRDEDALKRRAVEAAIERTAKAGQLSPDTAAARLYAERVPNTPIPDSPDAVREALMEREPAPKAQLAELATQRLEQLRAQAKRLRVDADRLPPLEPEVRPEAAFTGIELGLVSSQGSRPAGLIDRLRGLGRSITGQGGRE
jgi:hypothetical protein